MSALRKPGSAKLCEPFAGQEPFASQELTAFSRTFAGQEQSAEQAAFSRTFAGQDLAASSRAFAGQEPTASSQTLDTIGRPRIGACHT